MGKSEEEQATPEPPASATESPEGNACDGCPRCCCIGRIVRPRCVVTLILALAMLLSAVFWLPPFLRSRDGSGRPGRDSRFSADIVASFKLQKPVDFLKSNIRKLQLDIFDEIGVPGSSVAVIDLEPTSRSNWTNVIFSVWPYPKNSYLSSTELSILRASFVSLVLRQSTLHLTTSLFGNSSFFEVLKFSGGIVIIPFQRTFPLQNVQMLFYFTLNFPIYRIQDKFSELKDQMKSGLLLNTNENLYMILINSEGSTVSPPTIVKTSIVLTVGNRQPSFPRWKELAKKIRGSSSGNLGLNHTVFGRVKQVRLSSFLQHSSSRGSSNASPSPAPQPQTNHQRHHPHHQHKHHKHHYRTQRALAPAPSPGAAPEHSYKTSAPSGCRHGSSNKREGFSAPAASPVDALKHLISPVSAPKHSSGPAAVGKHSGNRPVSAPHHVSVPSSVPWHLLSPRAHESMAVPAPSIQSSSPKPDVSFPHVPPRASVKDNKAPGPTPSISPSPYSSSAPDNNSFRRLAFIPVLYVLLRL
ncbi:uncharacterized protein LOC121972012 isoform X1 [Zingiber officinale]|uniref:uncharacterized protein LOC121972012 isoform X1 n=1 Tax=Zingiber officinale TaxID=94328 RepID=UPI001C4B396C|nr:uncharacterized protein LOC121972012 isoform X1 [Zingiber officinale]